VTETLEIIFQLFNDTHKIKETYGCRPFTEQDEYDHIGMEAAFLSRVQPQSFPLGWG
jgi:hypothetical protein